MKSMINTGKYGSLRRSWILLGCAGLVGLVGLMSCGGTVRSAKIDAFVEEERQEGDRDGSVDSGQIVADGDVLVDGARHDVLSQDAGGRDAEILDGGGSDSGIVDGETIWQPLELEFVAQADHSWTEFPLQVHFSHASTQITVDGFWKGTRRWMVRFAPPEVGHWTWTSESSTQDPGLDGHPGEFDVVAATPAQIRENPNLRGLLRTSANGHFLVYADGTPFLWLGDTFWAFNTARATTRQGTSRAFYQWVDDRKQKHFTVLQISFLSKEGNEEGPSFWGSWGDFQDLNPPSFDALDGRIRYAWAHGFVIAGVPTWICLVNGMTLERAQNLERYLLARYGAFNLVYGLSGEYQYSATVDNLSWDEWDRLGEYADQHAEQGNLITVHPSWRPSWPAPHNRQSSDAFHQSTWLGLNLLQTGQAENKLYNIPGRCLQDWDLSPAKPVVHAEGWYEDTQSASPHRTSREAIRWQVYSALLNGCAGHTYGDNAGWLFYNPTEDSWTIPSQWSWYHTVWNDGMDEPGSGDMAHAWELFVGVLSGWWRLIPHRDWVKWEGRAPGTPETDVRFPSLAVESGRQVVLYVPAGNRGRTIRITHLGGGNWSGLWFDPRTGSTTALADPPSGSNAWTIPVRPTPRDGDWILVLLQ